MGFFKSLKGDHPAAIGSSSTSSGRGSSRDEKTPQNETFNPPPGPPPSYPVQGVHLSSHASPLDAASGRQEFAPPPGPPPNHSEEFAPPPGPPPGHTRDDKEPPPYHDWTVIPDTALLPPPPSIGREVGSSSNASSAEADRAHDWCKLNPLIRPHQPSNAQHGAVQHGDIRLMKSKEYKGDLLMPSEGIWKGSTRLGAGDSCLISSAPLYFAMADAPSQMGNKKTIYFEIEITSLGRGRNGDECSLAIGYCAMPYPTWRMPGWERGSLAIHSDDGCRYVNDTWGGKEFTKPFNQGDTVGLGITFSPPTVPSASGNTTVQTGQLNVETFFTRNGQKDGGWNLHEELDAETDQDVKGLDGAFDLYAAIGVFGGAEFKVKFQRQSWLYLPR